MKAARRAAFTVGVAARLRAPSALCAAGTETAASAANSAIRLEALNWDSFSQGSRRGFTSGAERKSNLADLRQPQSASQGRSRGPLRLGESFGGATRRQDAAGEHEREADHHPESQRLVQERHAEGRCNRRIHVGNHRRP